MITVVDCMFYPFKPSVLGGEVRAPRHVTDDFINLLQYWVVYAFLTYVEPLVESGWRGIQANEYPVSLRALSTLSTGSVRFRRTFKSRGV